MSINPNMQVRTRMAGFTLVELVLFIVVVSAAVVGVLGVMSYTSSHSADPQVRKQALSIAEALMEEVSLAKYTWCDPADPDAETASGVGDCHVAPENAGHAPPENGNGRPYDNVNDYVSSYGHEDPIDILDVNGGSPGLTGYKAFITISQETFGGIQATDSLHIRIRVTYGGTEMAVLDGYRTRYDPNLLP
jgi:MSHA pilin protein MshD